MYGSKINNLIKLKEKGFNVPKFQIIKFDDVIFDKDRLVEIFIENQKMSSKDLSNILKQYIEDNIVKDFKIILDAKFYAVRSSSNIEDGEDDSFAGQFDSFLEVQKQELNLKIIECFKSLYNENVIEYIRSKEINVDTFEMNVLVQEMVDSEISGILFTANPQGLLNESVIVVGKGLGDDVVLDKVNTTSYYYNLQDEIYYFDGIKDYLSRELVEELINISKKAIEVLDLGKYIDIEFGIQNNKIYVLQARQITTIDDSNSLILDNSNIVESYPDLSLPLTISFVHSIYTNIFSSLGKRLLKNEKELKKHKYIFNNMVGNVNGRMYYKLNNWYSLLQLLPFKKKIIPIWKEMMGVNQELNIETEVNLKFTSRFMIIINFLAEFILSQINMYNLNNSFRKVNNYFRKNFNKQLNTKEVMKLYNKTERDILKAWDITLINDIYAFVFVGILKKRLKKKYINYEEKENEYISGINNIESLKPIKELINIAYDKDNLTKKEYEKRLNSYVIRFGDRHLEELKLESLTFRTNPELLTEKIEEYRKDKKHLEKIYKDINKEYKISSKKEDIITRWLIKQATSGIKNREISRLNRSRIFGMVRAMFLQIGKIYKENRIILKERDIFYLKFEEIKEINKELELNNKNNKNEKEKNKDKKDKTNIKEVKDLILKRKEEYKIYDNLPAYSRLVFMDKEFDKTHLNVNMKKFYKNVKELRGIPCSNGIVKGEVLVVKNVNKVKNVRNKILVTKMTDPGWVFLLATAKGVISEKGSLLSHTAIISRELKIPAIVGVKDLLDTLNNGDIIEMDGNTGIIKILEKSKK